MKNTFVAMALAITIFFGLSLPAQEAEAKRLGGGSSFGMKRSVTPSQPAVAPKQATTPQQAAPAAATGTGAAAAQAAGKRSWLGPVAGLAAGLGLAALAAHLGFGEEMASFLLILLLVGGAFFLFRLLTRSRQQPQGQYSYAGAGAAGAPASAAPMRFEANQKVGAGGTASTGAAGNVPADFDTEGFLRQAKLNFIRLQAANDRGDMDDLKSFTAPEVFAEIQLQYEERQRQPQFTDVVQLDADLLEVTTDNGFYIASAYFHGLIREAEGAEAQPFGEIWHLAKPVDGSFGWRIAGIQQQA